MVIVYDTTLKERISSITFEEERYNVIYCTCANLVTFQFADLYPLLTRT